MSSSPIIQRRSTKALSERLESLEKQYLGLRERWIADMRREMLRGEGGPSSDMDIGTNKIEEFDTMDIFQETEKMKKLKSEIFIELQRNIAEVNTNLLMKLQSEVRQIVMGELDKIKDEVKAHVKKDIKEEVKDEIDRDILGDRTFWEHIKKEMKKEVKDEIHKDILGRINHAFVPDDHDDDHKEHKDPVRICTVP